MHPPLASGIPCGIRYGTQGTETKPGIPPIGLVGCRLQARRREVRRAEEGAAPVDERVEQRLREELHVGRGVDAARLVALSADDAVTNFLLHELDGLAFVDVSAGETPS